MIAQANCAVAFRHLAVCDWASTINPALKSVAACRASGQQNRFGDALARLPMNWSYLWLGQLSDLCSNVSVMSADADERNDQSVAQLVQLGLGCVVDLMSDSVQRHARSARPAKMLRSPWSRVLSGFSQLMKLQYDGDLEHAVRYHRALVSGQPKKLIQQIQFLRVLALQFEANIHIANACQHPSNRDGSIAIVQRVCHDLRKERIGYANAIRTYFQAQVLEVVGDMDQAAPKYAQAVTVADSLGLIPMKLAAKDRFAMVLGDNGLSELEDFLTSSGVIAPAKFARIYCGLR